MYRIMDRNARLTFVTMIALGKERDATTALYIAMDQDALASRLLDCADTHFALARCALTPTGALRESARALQLMECAGEAKRFADYMLDGAVAFECAQAADENSKEWVWASNLRSAFIYDHIFPIEGSMYGVAYR